MRHALRFPTPDPEDDEREGTGARTARVLEAMDRLLREVVRENALLRLSIDRRLGLLEDKLLDQPHGSSTVVPLEVTLRRPKRPPARSEATCATCGATFLRAHPTKVRCDACTYQVRLAEATARNRRLAEARRALRSHASLD